MATKIFPSPLSNDFGDRLNHKWMLLLMLLLSLVSFIIPLHPIYKDSTEQTPPPTNRKQVLPIPTFEVACWTPSQFTDAHIVYATTHCKKQYNAAVRGQGDTDVYIVNLNEVLPIDRQRDGFQKVKPIQKQFIEIDPSEEDLNKFKERVAKLLSFQAPITLFLVAVGLALSHVIWAILIECCGSFNLEKTLDAASNQTKYKDVSSRKQVFEDIAESLTASTRSSPRCLSFLYLTKKIVSAVFALCFLIVVVQHSLPEIEKLQDDYDKLSTTPAVDEMSKADANSTSNSSVPDDNATGNEEYFLCDLSLRQLTRIESFTLQCLAVDSSEQNNVINELGTSASSSSNSSATSSSSTTGIKNLLEFELLLFKIVVAFLVVLVVNNIVSLLTWTCRFLSGSSRASLGLSDNIPLDVMFLIQMARINASAEVAHTLTHSFGGVKV